MQEFQFDPRKKGRAYSKGNRQKVALIAALAVPADLYIFDEPTSGLDPLMEVVFRREIARMQDAGATVLLSSHILSEVELLCDRVSIIRAGRIVEIGHAGRAAPPHPHRGLLRGDGCRAPPARHPRRARRRRSRTAARGSPSTATRWPRHPSGARTRDVTGLRVEPPSLEELFLRHYGDDLPAGSRTPASTPGRGAIAGRRPGDERSSPRCCGSGCAATGWQLLMWIVGTALLAYVAVRRRLRVVRHAAGPRRRSWRPRWRTPSSCCSAGCRRGRTRARSCCS